MTSYKPRPAGTLKDAVDRLIDEAGGLKRAADLAGKSTTVLARYSDPGEPTRQMPVDVARALERESEYPHVSAYLVREAGYAVLPMAAPGDEVPALVAQSMRETSDVFIKATEALADLTITPDEAGELIQEIDEAMTQFQALRRKLVELRGAPPLKEVKR